MGRAAMLTFWVRARRSQRTCSRASSAARFAGPDLRRALMCPGQSPTRSSSSREFSVPFTAFSAPCWLAAHDVPALALMRREALLARRCP
eukprot:4337688-Pyramimonas_sp.AAC.1